jgi:tRNA 2-selenouridine synthase
MPIQRLAIKDFLQRSRNAVLLDVRSPGEYNHAHIPGACSLPLFTDEERKVVGTTYKQESREQAIKVGLDYFGPKMRKMVEEVEAIGNKQLATGEGTNSSEIRNPKSEIFIYCWRGGMRSAGVAWLLDLYGFKVYTLAGGYKAFRNHVLQSFNQPFNFRILGGYTGSGKTEVLHELERLGEKTVDLEGIACHKGSAFGAFNMPKPPTQEMFENLLAARLEEVAGQRSEIRSQKSEVGSRRSEVKTAPGATHSRFPVDDSRIWLEDESQRIGNLNLPGALWENMRKSPILFLDIDFDKRLNHIVEEYGACDREKLIGCVERISKRLGGLDAKNTIAFLEEGNIPEAFRILLRYYDKRYLKGLHNRENISTLLTTVACENVDPGNAALLSKYQPA